MTYLQLNDALNKVKHDYDSDRFYRDSEYRKEQEPFLRKTGEEQQRLLLQYRHANPVLTPHDEESMILELMDPKKSSRVAFVLRIMPGFSRSLLRAMIKAACDCMDPSSNRIFIEPCTRFFDAFAVNDVVLDFVVNGTKEEKIGAMRCFYWIRSRIVRFQICNGPMQEELIEYRWNGKAYTNQDENRKYLSLGEAALNEYKPKVELMLATRQKILLDRLSVETDVDVLLALFRELPESPDVFPDEFQSMARKLYLANERELVLATVEPYRKLAGVSDDALRAKIHEEARKESAKLKAEVQMKILANRNLN